MNANEHRAAIEAALEQADEAGFTLLSDDYTGEFYLQGSWNDKLQRYNRYYLWEDQA